MATDEMPVLSATQRTLLNMLSEAVLVYGPTHGIVLLAAAAFAWRGTPENMDRCCTVAIELLVDQLEEAF